MEIPFCKPYINGAEQKAVEEVLGSGKLTHGGKVEEFEELFAEYIGSKYAVAVSCGTAALFLSVAWLKHRYPDPRFEHNQRINIAVPALTFTASASVIKQNGYEPNFIDVKKDGKFLMDIDQLMETWTDARKGAIIVALTGNEPDIDYPHKEKIIIDSAHRIRRGDGKSGYTRTFSFHPTKEITTGFGGMITTDDPEMVEWLKKARIHGIRQNNNKTYGYTIEFCGWKMNMTDIQAAMGIAQLKKLDKMTEERKRVVEAYNELLGLDRTGYHLYPVLVNNRPEFMKLMEKAGINCSIHFSPLNEMPAYWDGRGYRRLENTEYIGAHIVSLPLYPELKQSEIEYVCQKAKETGLLLPS